MLAISPCASVSTDVSTTCSLNISNGAAANGITSADSTVNARSGMEQALRHAAMGLQRGKETINRLPRLPAARYAAPSGANHAGQRITLVDRRAVVLTRPFAAVHEQRFDV